MSFVAFEPTGWRTVWLDHTAESIVTYVAEVATAASPGALLARWRLTVPAPTSVCYHWVVANEQGGERAQAPALADGTARRSHDMLLRSVPGAGGGPGGSESLVSSGTVRIPC